MQRIALIGALLVVMTAAVMPIDASAFLAAATHFAAIIEPSHWSPTLTATAMMTAAATVTRSSFTIEEFCRRNGISKSFFYKLRNMGKGPRLMDVGSHKRVSVEAEADWKLAREADAAEAA
jgi:hypothetical protein